MNNGGLVQCLSEKERVERCEDVLAQSLRENETLDHPKRNKRLTSPGYSNNLDPLGGFIMLPKLIETNLRRVTTVDISTPQKNAVQKKKDTDNVSVSIDGTSCLN